MAIGANAQQRIPAKLSGYFDMMYRDNFEYLNRMVGDTVSFDLNKYSKSLIESMYEVSVDTVWYKQIKNKQKAILGKHYKIVDKHTNILVSRMTNKRFVIYKVEKTDKTSSSGRRSGYANVYLRNVANPEEVIKWVYETNCNYRNVSNPDGIAIKVQNIETLIRRLFVNDNYYYRKTGLSYNSKDGYRAYEKVKCVDFDFVIDSKYLSARLNGIYEADNGSKYSYRIDPSKNSLMPIELITNAEYEVQKEKAIGYIINHGKYSFVLSEVEKPRNTQIRYGETTTIKSEQDGLSRYLYKDNIISILWYGTKSNFEFKLMNNSVNSVKIIWDDAVFIDNKNSADGIIHKGVKYKDANVSQPPTVIPKGMSIDEIIIPKSKIKYRDGWYNVEMVDKSWGYYEELDGALVKVLLPIEIKGIINEYTFTFKMEWTWDYPELRK